jgi:hypothetical protein
MFLQEIIIVTCSIAPPDCMLVLSIRMELVFYPIMTYLIQYMMSKRSAILFGQPYHRPGHNQLTAYAWDECLLGMVFCFWLADAIDFWLYILTHVLFFLAHHLVRMELLFCPIMT